MSNRYRVLSAWLKRDSGVPQIGQRDEEKSSRSVVLNQIHSYYRRDELRQGWQPRGLFALLGKLAWTHLRGLHESIFLHPVNQGLTSEIQKACGARLVPLTLLQGLEK
jgi:hypothetical protein